MSKEKRLRACFAITHPEKAKFWHPENSENLAMHSFGSSAMVAWRCTDNPSHEWQMRIIDFLKRDRDCPICSKRGSVSPKSTLIYKAPSIAAEWDDQANSTLRYSPESVLWKAPNLVNWVCKRNKSHKWKSSIAGRTINGEGCPFCYKKKIDSNFALSNLAELAEEWDFYENPESLNPEVVDYRTSLVVSWICNESHRFKATLEGRVTRGIKCFVCNRPNESYSTLAEARPDLLREWHFQKNTQHSPYELTCGSVCLVYWICSEKHVWRASIAARAGKSKRGCPYCTKKHSTPEHNLRDVFPEIAEEFDLKRNNGLTPEDFTPKSGKQVWWKCSKDKTHVWMATVLRRTISKGKCPYCSGRRISSQNRLATKYKKLALEWHPTKNEDLTPSEVSFGSKRIVWWQCKNNPEHDWQATIKARTRQKTTCPSCGGGKRATKFRNALVAKPEVASEWHPTLNGDLKPQDVTPGSAKRVFWLCPVADDHVWERPVCARILVGEKCPFCLNRRLSKTNSLKARFPKVAKLWHKTKNKTKRPEDFLPSSNESVWWQCLKFESHEWNSTIRSRVRLGANCPVCARVKNVKKKRD